MAWCSQHLVEWIMDVTRPFSVLLIKLMIMKRIILWHLATNIRICLLRTVLLSLWFHMPVVLRVLRCTFTKSYLFWCIFLIMINKSDQLQCTLLIMFITIFQFRFTLLAMFSQSYQFWCNFPACYFQHVLVFTCFFNMLIKLFNLFFHQPDVLEKF